MSWRDEIMTVTVRARDICDGDRIVDPAVLASMSLDEPDAPMVTDASVERGAVTLSCAGGGVLEFAPDRLLQVERRRPRPIRAECLAEAIDELVDAEVSALLGEVAAMDRRAAPGPTREAIEALIAEMYPHIQIASRRGMAESILDTSPHGAAHQIFALGREWQRRNGGKP